MGLAVGLIADAYKAPTGGAWTPASLTNLLGWWDASDATTFTYSSGVVVSQWNDKSGNARHFTQGTVSSQPSRNATLNGLAGVSFTTDDYMDHDAGSDVIDISPWTFWAVVDFATRIDPDGRILTARRSATGAYDYQTPNAIILTRSSTTDDLAASSSSTSSAIATGGTSAMIVGSRMNGTQVFARGPGGETAATTATAPGNIRYLRTGGICATGGNPPASGTTNNLDAAIYEMFLCNADVTATDAVTYLTTKWGIGAFTPTQIAGLQAWYDASDAASITSSGGAVSQWNDKSTNARHVTQGTAANKPTTGTNTMNGLNVLTFDGTNDCLIGPVAQLVNATTGEWSAFSVHKPSSVTGVRNVIDQDKGSAPKTAQYFRNNGTASNALAFNTAGNALVDTAATVTINTAAQYSGVRGATTIELWMNGTSNGLTATTGTPSTDGTAVFSVGRTGAGAQFWAGDIAEVIVYNTALSTTDRQAVEAYLKAKWGTP